jgi:hypothetical protein
MSINWILMTYLLQNILNYRTSKIQESQMPPAICIIAERGQLLMEAELPWTGLVESK